MYSSSRESITVVFCTFENSTKSIKISFDSDSIVY